MKVVLVGSLIARLSMVVALSYVAVSCGAQPDKKTSSTVVKGGSAPGATTQANPSLGQASAVETAVKNLKVQLTFEGKKLLSGQDVTCSFDPSTLPEALTQVAPSFVFWNARSKTPRSDQLLPRRDKATYKLKKFTEASSAEEADVSGNTLSCIVSFKFEDKVYTSTASNSVTVSTSAPTISASALNQKGLVPGGNIAPVLLTATSVDGLPATFEEDSAQCVSIILKPTTGEITGSMPAASYPAKDVVCVQKYRAKIGEIKSDDAVSVTFESSNRAPVVTCDASSAARPPLRTLATPIQCKATDPDLGNEVKLSLKGSCAGLNIDEKTGLITGTMNLFSCNAIVSGTDGLASTDVTLSLTASDSVPAPVLSRTQGYGGERIDCLSLAASDLDGVPLISTFKFYNTKSSTPRSEQTLAAGETKASYILKNLQAASNVAADADLPGDTMRCAVSYQKGARTKESVASAALSVVISPNTAPTLSTISTLTGASEDTAFTISYTTLLAAANEADEDVEDTIRFRVESVSTGTLKKFGTLVTPGSSSIGPGEDFVWTPAANANGTLDAFTVVAFDGELVSAAPVQVKAQVVTVNDTPTLNTITNVATTVEDTAVTISYNNLAAAADEFDIESDPISFRVEAVVAGTLTKNGSAVVPGTTTLGTGESLVWTPALNSNGPSNAFSVKAFDGTVASATAVVVPVNVTAVNDAPTMTAVTALGPTNEDIPLVITHADLLAAANEADVDGDTLSFELESLTSGTLTYSGGVISYGVTRIASGQSVTWTPPASTNGNGLNAFKIRVHDSTVASSADVQVQVDVAPVNNAPTLTTITNFGPVSEDNSITISYSDLAAAANEADIDGDTISFRLESLSSGTLTHSGGAITYGTTALATGESVTWTPAANINGNNVSAFKIRAFDGQQTSTADVQVLVDISAVNDAPTVSTATNFGPVNEDTAITITYADLQAATNEADVDGDTVNFRLESLTSGTLTHSAGAITYGTTLITSGQSVTWTPATDANGATVNAFKIRAHDGTTASTTDVQITANLSPINDAPTLTSISTLNGVEDTSLTISYNDIIANADESDVDLDSLVFRIEAVSTGTLSKNSVLVTAGTTTIASGESVVWTPASNSNGTINAFTLKAYDGSAYSLLPVQLSVNVAAQNDAPTLTTVTTLGPVNEDTGLVITHADLLSAADEADIDGNTVNFRIESLTTGTLAYSGGAITYGTTVLSAGQSVTWTPATNANGNALNAFKVRAFDGTVASGSDVQVSIDVTAVNDAPTITSVTALGPVNEDASLIVTYADLLAAADETDVDGNTVNFRVESLTSGTLSYSGGGITYATTVLSAGQTLTWTPATNSSGNGIAAFKVRAYDGTVTNGSDVQVSVDVTPINDAPTLTTVTNLGAVNEDTALTITYADLLAAADEADADGNTINFRIESLSTGTLSHSGGPITYGTTLVAAGDSLTWTPSANSNGNGVNAFKIRAHDGTTASTADVQVNVDVTAVNDAPTLTTISNLGPTNEDTAIVISYDDLIAAANETDLDGNTVNFRLESLTSGTLSYSGGAITYGTTVVSTGQTLTWTPAANANGVTVNAFKIRAHDGTTTSASDVQVTVHVTAVNDAPTLTSISEFSGTEDTSLSISYNDIIASGDEADVESDTLVFRIEAVSTGTLTKNGVLVTPGSTTIASGETVVWTPVADNTGSKNAFTVKAYDGAAYSLLAVQVSVNLAAANDAPTLTSISTFGPVNEDTALVITYADLAAAANESDVDGNTLNFRLESLTTGTLTYSGGAITYGATVVSAGQSITWTPASNSYGSALTAFKVRATDGSLTNGADVQVTVDVTAVNDAPTLTSISALGPVNEESSLVITYADLVAAANEADVDGNTINFTLESLTTGTLTHSGGAITYGTTTVAAGQSVTWTPAANANGAGLNAFKVRAHDGITTNGADVQVTVDVGSVNDAPTLTSVTALGPVNEDTALTITYADLLAAANEADLDGDTVNFRIESLTTGTLGYSSGAITYGTTVLSSGESLTWTPVSNANGNGIAAFKIRAHDGSTTNGADIQVSVNVTAVNDAPTLTSVSTFGPTNEDTAITISYADLAAAANEADIDADIVNFRLESLTAGTLSYSGGAITYGTTVVSSGQSVTWTPAANVNGSTIAAFKIRAFDGTTTNGADLQISVDVTSQNDAPTLTAISALGAVNEDSSLTITYADLLAAADEADADGNAVDFRIESLTTGSLTYSGGAITYGSTLISTGQSVTWTPAANANGSPLNAFKVRAFDGTTASGADVQLTVNVTAVNDTPVLTAVSEFSGIEDTQKSITYADLVANGDESDVDGDTLVFRIEAVSSGTLTKNAVLVTAGTTTIASGETVVWTPGSNDNGSKNAFTIKAYDGAAYSLLPVQVSVNLTAQNDAPTLTSISALGPVNEDSPLTITYADLAAAANEADTDGNTVNFRIESLTSGTLSYSGGAITYGTTVLSSGESLTWTPDSNANGNGLSAFKVRAHDSTTTSGADVQVTVNVTPVNDAPTLTSISALGAVNEDTALTITYADLIAAANEADVDGDTVNFRLESLTNGTLTYSGGAITYGTTVVAAGESVTWTPAANASGNGLAAFKVRASDGTTTNGADVQVTVNVTTVNDLPTLTTVSAFGPVNEDTARVITYAELIAAANEADIDGDTVNFRLESLTAGALTHSGGAITYGTTVIAAGDSVTWTPAANVNGNGVAAFKIRAFDGTAASTADVQVTVDITAVNDAPTLTSVSPLGAVNEDTALTISYADLAAAADEADIEGSTLSFRIESLTTGTLTYSGGAITYGTTLLSSGQSLTWTPASNANGNGLSAFKIRVHDGTTTNAADVQVTVNVTAQNDAPTLTTVAAFTGTEDTAKSISFADLITNADELDVDGDAIVFRIEAVSGGTLTKNAALVTAGTTTIATGETVEWTPDANDNGVKNAFTIKAYDGTAYSLVAVQVTVNLAAVNDAPTFTTISTLGPVNEDTALTITYADLLAAANEADTEGNTINFRVESLTTGSLTYSGGAITYGTTIVSTGESLTWTPASNANGNALSAFKIRAHDGTTTNGADVQVVVDVTAVNDAPSLSAVSALGAVNEDTALTITYADLQAAADESDADGNTVNFRIESLTSGTLTHSGGAITYGTTLLAAGQSLTWTPAADASGNGITAFKIRAHDGSTTNGADVQVSVNVTATNDAPTLTSVSALGAVNEDSSLTITYADLVAAADEADIDGNTVNFRLESLTSGTLTHSGGGITYGTTLLTAGQSLTWTPAADVNGNGVNAFKIRAYDGTTTSTADVQVTVNVTAQNDAPTLSSVAALGAVNEDTALTITYADLAAAANEADVDGNTVNFRIESLTTGSLTYSGGAITYGTTVLSTGESLSWSPAANAFGTPLNAFKIRATDGTTTNGADVQVTVNVTAQNDTPTLTSISSFSGTEDTAKSISFADLVANGDEADIDGDTLVYRIEAVSSGILTKNAVAVVAGTTTIATGDTVVWTPATNDNGLKNAFTVKVFDGTSYSLLPIQVTVNLTAANDAPTLTSVSALGPVNEDTALTITYAQLAAAADEADIDGDTVSFRLESLTNGTLTYSGGAITYGTTTVSSGESVTWTPDADVNGNATTAFKIRAFDGTTASAADVQVSVDVTAQADAPTLTSVSALGPVNEDTALTISYADLLAAANEADVDGGTINFRLESLTNGTLTYSGGAITYGTTIISSGQTLSWTPASNANGNGIAAFKVRAHDGTNVSNADVQVSVNVTAQNDTPVLTAVSEFSGLEDTQKSISYNDLITNGDEYDADADTLVFRIEAVSSGTLTKNSVLVTAGTTTIASGETVVWTPATNENGSKNAFTIKAYDGTAYSLLAVQVSVNLTAQNDAPTLTSVTTLGPVNEDTGLTITYATLAAAADEADTEGNTVNFRIESLSSGTLTYSGGAITYGTTVLSSGQSLTWTPAANANGNALPAFKIRAHDGANSSGADVDVLVDVTAVNDAPTLTNVAALGPVNEETAITITYADLIAAADENDAEASTISFRIQSLTAGTLTYSGGAIVYGTTLISSGESVTWTPANNAAGAIAAFKIRAHDGSLVSTADVDVNFNVTNTSDAPSLTTVSALAGTEDTPLTITYAALAAAADEADPDGDTVNFKIESLTTGSLTYSGGAITYGSTVISAGQSVTWTPAANAAGTLNAFVITAYDGALASSSVQVTVSATDVNDTPTINSIADQGFTVNSGGVSGVAFTVDEGGGSDEDSQNLTVTATSSDTSVIANGNITVTYTADNGADATGGTLAVTSVADKIGVATITVTVDDGSASATTTFEVSVRPMGTSLQAWFVADKGLTKDGSNYVSAWKDYSGNNYHGAQATASQQPLYVADGGSTFNNKPVMRFDGGDCISLGNAVDIERTDNFTVIAVAKLNSSGSQAIVSKLTQGGSYIGWEPMLYSPGTGLYSYLVNTYPTNAVEAYASADLHSSPNIITVKYDGGSNANGLMRYKNGILLSSTAASANNLSATISSSTEMAIGARNCSVYFVNGDIAEVIIYKSQILESERYDIESYLSQKYNIAIPTNNVVETSDLALWLEAGSGVTKDSSNAVSTWNDQSGNGFNLTQSTAANQPTWVASQINSRPVVRFDGNDNIAKLTNMTGFSQQLSMFMVMKQTVVTGYPVPFEMYANGAYHFHVHTPYDTTSSYWSQRQTVRGNPGIDNTSYYILSWHDDTVDAVLYNNGVRQVTYTGGSNLSFNSSNSGINLANSSASYMTGDIAEVVLYSRALSETERQKIHSYLAVKYNINTLPSSSQKLWLRADKDTYSDTGCTTPSTNGGAVGCWKDQSASAVDATQAVAGTTPLLANSQKNEKPTLTFDGNDYLSLSSSIAMGTEQTNFIVSKGNSGVVVGGASMHYFPYVTGTSQCFAAGSADDYLCKTAPSNFSNWSLHGFLRDSLQQLFYAQNGSTYASATYGYNGSLTLSSVGAYSSGASAFTGSISEVIAYNTALTTEETQRVNSYLNEKYALSISTEKVLDQPGLQMWLKADSGITRDANAAQFVGANGEYLSIADNASLSIDDSETSFSLAGWFNATTIAGNQGIFGKYQSTTDKEYLIDLESGYLVFNPPDLAKKVTGPLVTAGKWYFVTVTYDASTDVASMRVNDTTTYTTTGVTGPTDSASEFVIGRYYTGQYFNGSVSKVGMWKSKVLSSAEITELYNNGAGLSYSSLSAGLKTNLMAYWNLTEASGTRNDSHTNALHLTDNNTVTQGYGPTSPVSSWADQSGNGSHASQSTEAYKPVWIADAGSGLNNKPALRYTGGSSHYLLTSSMSAMKTVFVVAKRDNSAAPASDRALYSQGTATDKMSLGLVSGFTYFVSQLIVSSTTYESNTAAATANTDPHVFASVANGSTFQTFFDGVGQANTAAAAAAHAAPMYVGYNFDGDIAEVIGYRSVLTTAQRQAVECYLSSKYNITLSGVTCN